MEVLTQYLVWELPSIHHNLPVLEVLGQLPASEDWLFPEDL